MLSDGVTDEGLKHLAGMSKLSFLEISDSPITGKGISVLGGMKDMNALYLINTQIGDDGLEIIGRLHKLKVLNLSSSKITDAGMRHLEGLTEIENLVLEHTRISDACIGSLSKLDKLSYILLGGTRVTEQGRTNCGGSCQDSKWNSAESKHQATKCGPSLCSGSFPELPPTLGSGWNWHRGFPLSPRSCLRIVIGATACDNQLVAS